MAQQPVTPFQAVFATPKGMADAASVSFLAFLVGEEFSVVDKTDALRKNHHETNVFIADWVN